MQLNPHDPLGWGVCCPQQHVVPSCPQPFLLLEQSPMGLFCWQVLGTFRIFFPHPGVFAFEDLWVFQVAFPIFPERF